MEHFICLSICLPDLMADGMTKGSMGEQGSGSVPEVDYLGSVFEKSQSALANSGLGKADISKNFEDFLR